MATTSRDSPLLERDGELGRLDGFIAETVSGEGRVVLVEGPAGIGKTRLVLEARRRGTDAGLQVFSARGSELERDFPFGVVRQLFETAVTTNGDGLLSGSAEGAAAIFGQAMGPAGDGADTSFSALHGLYWLSVNLASATPTLLAIDDLHWCDRPSLRYLAYLVRRLEGLPLVAVGSLRPAEPGSDLALLAEIAGDPSTAILRPSPLSTEATSEIIERRLSSAPDGDFTSACHGATGGNPLLLNELLTEMEAADVAPDAAGVRAVAEIGPRAVSRGVLARLSRLAPEAVAVAGAVAVLGDGAHSTRIAELAEVDERTVAHAGAELARVEILSPEPPIGFTHPLVRAAIYHNLPPAERDRQHARAARLLADANAPAELVAAHLVKTPAGGGEAWVTETLSRAATAAAARGAAESATELLRRALAETPDSPRVDLLLQLGAAEALTDGQSAVKHVRAAYDAIPDPIAKAGVGTLLSRLLLFTDRPTDVEAVVRDATALLPDSENDLRYRLLANRLSACHWDPVRNDIHDPDFARFRGDLVADSPGAREAAGVSAYQWAMTGGTAAECAALARRAVSDGVLIESDNATAAVGGSLIVLAYAGDPAGRLGSEASLAAAYRAGSIFAAAGAHMFLGLANLCEGDLPEAERLCRVSRDQMETWGFDSVKAFASGWLAEALIERGNLAEARRVLDWPGFEENRPPGTHLCLWDASRLKYLVASGDAEGAVAHSRECEDRYGNDILNPSHIPWRSVRAEALHRLGRADEAVLAAESELPHARQWGAPRALGRSLRVLGTVSGDLATLEEAVAVLEGSPARLELAKALAAYGTQLRLLRRPTDAREPLRQALALASVCDATPLVEHIRTEISATGARPRTDALTGVAALTSSERRVADLAVEGATNKDIAQALYVTPKTVEVHLSNTYRKLGIKSRRELPGALANE